MKYCIRAVSPDVYDEAARTSPERCPLVLAGDLRSGQELLKGARADSMQTIESLVASRKGRMMLNALAEHIEAQVLAIEEMLGWNRLSASLNVPRPIAFNIDNVSLDMESPVMMFCVRQGLAGMCSTWIFNSGFASFRMIQILRSLPPRIFAGLTRLIEAMRQSWPAELLESSRAGSRSHLQDSMSYANKCRCLSFEEESIWEAEKEIGLMKMEFDPSTQRRTNLAINSRIASFWGLHKEEFLIRLATHEASNGLPDLCTVCLLVSLITGSMHCEEVIYSRMCIRFSNEIHGILMRQEVVKMFNSKGQLTQVIACFIFNLPHISSSFQNIFPSITFMALNVLTINRLR